MVRRTLRVLAVVVVLAGTVAAIALAARRRASAPAPAPTPTPTPSPSADSPPPAPTRAADSSPPSAEPTITTPAWLPPTDGQCPEGYPVKVNESSGIFHVPGGRFYGRTIPDRCYTASDAATADGYRQAKA